MFIVPGHTELISLSWFIVCCECFIHLFSSGVQWRSPGRGYGDRVPRSWNIFKVRYITWNLRPGENERHNLMPLTAIFLLQCTPALCCFSVMLHNVWHLGGHGPLGPPPKSALEPRTRSARTTTAGVAPTTRRRFGADRLPVDAIRQPLDCHSTSNDHRIARRLWGVEQPSNRICNRGPIRRRLQLRFDFYSTAVQSWIVAVTAA